jgi:hypothetical protein
MSVPVMSGIGPKTDATPEKKDDLNTLNIQNNK